MGTLSIINAAVFDGVSDGLADGPVHVADGRIVSVGGPPQPADEVALFVRSGRGCSRVLAAPG